MKPIVQPGFAGFRKEGIAYLKGVAKNNNKSWFESHKKIYEENLLQPMQELFTAIENPMSRIDPMFMIDPRPGKGITRPYRDTRFSKDKSPYKSTIWFTYRRAIKEWQDYPAFYFEIMTDGYRYGTGFFLASRQTMSAFRNIIDTDPKRFKKAADMAILKGGYSVEGDIYARPLKELPEESAVWYNRKNIYLIKQHKHDSTLFSPSLAKVLTESFKTIVPIYRIMCEASHSWKI